MCWKPGIPNDFDILTQEKLEPERLVLSSHRAERRRTVDSAFALRRDILLKECAP